MKIEWLLKNKDGFIKFFFINQTIYNVVPSDYCEGTCFSDIKDVIKVKKEKELKASIRPVLVLKDNTKLDILSNPFRLTSNLIKSRKNI